jgi:nicotinamidase-related amidase
MRREDAVLLVIDTQEPFLRAIFERERVIANSIKLIKAACILGIPVITTLQYRERMGDVVAEIAEVLPNNERFDKMTFSCCGSDAFVSKLRSLGRRTVIICGIETHVCINQTTLDLVDDGYSVQIAADAVSSRRQYDWQIGLEKLRQAGAVITTAEAAVLELLRDASAPEFKAILELVK